MIYFVFNIDFCYYFINFKINVFKQCGLKNLIDTKK